MAVGARASVYPLGQDDVTPAIQEWDAFRAHGPDGHTGSMSTLLEGNTQAVLTALGDAFQAAAEHGGTVMVITLSSASPPAQPQEGSAGVG
jgi:uncharacterized protein YqgV (UPF0045/DUF77 family)